MSATGPLPTLPPRCNPGDGHSPLTAHTPSLRSQGDAISEVKAALATLGQDGPTEEALAAALARKQRAEQEASYDPRTRLTKLWLGEAPAASTPAAPLTRDTMRTFFAQTFSPAALVVVQAKRK